MSSPPRIVVPLDGSKLSENALSIVPVIAGVLEATVELIHVAAASDATGEGDRQRVERDFVAYAQRLVRMYRLGACDCKYTVLFGPAAEEILRASTDATAIVLASHGRGGFRATFIGSVADKVVRQAEIPVLVVPGVGGPPGKPRRVLVALDGSPEAEAALALARLFAAKLGAKMTLLRAWTPVYLSFREHMVYPERLSEAIEGDVHDYLDRVKREGEATVVVASDAAGAIIDTAAALDEDLVVMTKTGKGLASRLVLGSTTDRVLHSLYRPLLLVPATRPSSGRDSVA